MRYIILLFSIFLLFSCTSNNKNVDSIIDPTQSKVFFKNINDGDTLESPFTVEMGVLGMTIKPAGQPETGTGHHHILIDKSFMSFGEMIPMDDTHLHYGKGDTVATISLSKGSHTLTLQFANGMHMSYGEEYSNTINVYIK
tara:strand:- start:124 stop:546 length:423 start_codon:yes stop_codon:yes gene_type:complete